VRVYLLGDPFGDLHAEIPPVETAIAHAAMITA
jgi:hypothetical protein